MPRRCTSCGRTQQEALQPLLRFNGVPYQDNEATGTALNESGKQLERDVTAALRAGRRTLPLLDAELTGDRHRSADRATRAPPRSCGSSCWPAC